MNIYCVSIQLPFQTHSWWFLADNEEELPGMLGEVIGENAVVMLKSSLLIDLIPFEKGLISFNPVGYRRPCSKTDNTSMEADGPT